MIFHVVLLLYSLLLFLSVKSSPLLGTFGFESANFFALLLGPFLLLNGSLNTADKKRGFSQILTREVGWLFLTLAIISSLLFINGLVLTSCSSGAGFWPFAVILFPALLLNVTLGCIIATLFLSRRLKIFLVIAGYLLYYAWISFSWWQHATFRSLSHASFLMGSDLLEGDTLTLFIIGYRTATLLLSLALILFGIYFLNPQTKKMFVTAKRHPIIMLWALLLLSTHITLDLMSTKGMGKDRSQLLKDYSILAEKNGIKIYADPQKTSRKDAERILHEAEYYQAKFSKRLGKLEQKSITIWLHKTAEDKFLYTGAKNVHFALPRHREIHISGYDSPHGVLGHELAHIILGEYTDSLLGYPSASWLVPNLGLTEGLAVALTSELNINNDLTLMEQAQALYQAQVRVDFSKLFSENPIYFATYNPQVSYIYAGAILEFLLAKNPNLDAQTIKKLVEKGTLAAIYPSVPDQKAFFKALTKKLEEPIALYAINWAHNNFKSSSIITSDCGRKLQKAKERLNLALINLDIPGTLEVIELLPKANQLAFYKEAIDRLINDCLKALPLFDKALLLAKADQFELYPLKLKQFECLVKTNNFSKAEAVLKGMDLAQYSPSSKRYLYAMDLMIHSYEAGVEPELSLAVINYFISQGQPIELIYLAFELGREKSPTVLSSLARYLLARYELNIEKRYSLALISLEKAIDGKLLPEEFEKEAELLRIKALLGLKEEQKARFFYDGLTFKPSPAERLWILNQLDRLAFYRTHK